MEPIERSISPAVSTKVMPTAITVTGAVCCTMLTRFDGVAKPSSRSRIANAAKISEEAAVDDEAARPRAGKSALGRRKGARVCGKLIWRRRAPISARRDAAKSCQPCATLALVTVSTGATTKAGAALPISP